MKKRIYALVVLAVFIVTIFSFGTAVFASTPRGTQLGSSDIYYYYDANTKTLSISGTGNMPYMSNSTTSIPWLEWSSSKIERIVVEEGVTSIGNYAFNGLAATSITLPSTLKTIGKYSFANTFNLEHIELPYGVTSIGSGAFEHCTRLNGVVLPSRLTTIGLSAFNDCSSLTSIEIPYTVTSIGQTAFGKCVSLNEVRFQSLSQKITFGTDTFLGCSMLKSITIPQNARCATRFFGYELANKKYSDVKMYVFENSLAHNFAVGNGFDFELIDTIPIITGVELFNTFTSDNQSKSIHYTFTPRVSQEYVLYTFGDCDTRGDLYFGSSLLASNDDIDASNSSFAIKQKLEQGKTYDLYVNSNRMNGDFSLVVLPAKIASLEAYGDAIERNANDGAMSGGVLVFSILPKEFEDYSFLLGFDDGTQYFTNFHSYIAGEKISVLDDSQSQKQKPFSCGTNTGKIALGNAEAEYTLNISHSYTSKTVSPTEDKDGYDLYTCILCGDSYQENFVATTSFVVTGNCYLSEHPILDYYENKIPYSNAVIKVGNRSYPINEDGTWSIRTFTNCYAVFENQYGTNVTVRIDVSGGSFHYGDVVLGGYDFNSDGHVNAKDFAIYRREKAKSLDPRYWDYADKFIFIKQLISIEMLGHIYYNI